jgi:nanoRNase/pAp phosphatase (c-di-AMP/oligoRNAs hydrolase)
MALNEYQQAYTNLGQKKNILLIAGPKEIEDTYPASVALATVLGRNKKEVTLFSPASPGDQFSFLGESYNLQKTIQNVQDLVISFDCAQKPIKQIHYTRKDNKINIHVTSSGNARLEPEDACISRVFNYDLIVTLGLDDMASLGKEFERNASFFFETPILNIDKNSSNERYGQVNIIEPTLSSCSEIAVKLLKQWGEEHIMQDVATCLLTGIIASTNNFQNNRTKPNTLYEAAYLISREADQQKIIQYLFKTKSFEFLRLWGIAMSKLQYEDRAKLGWLTLSQNDFKESGATPRLLPSIMTELKNNFAAANTFVIFWENSQNSQLALVHSLHTEQMRTISERLGGVPRGNNLLLPLSSQEPAEQKKLIEQISYSLEHFAV